MKAALFLLALSRCIARGGHAFGPVCSAFVWAFKCLIAPFAWGKPLLDYFKENNEEDKDYPESSGEPTSFEAAMDICFYELFDDSICCDTLEVFPHSHPLSKLPSNAHTVNRETGPMLTLAKCRHY